MNREADNYHFVSTHVYMHLAFKEFTKDHTFEHMLQFERITLSHDFLAE